MGWARNLTDEMVLWRLAIPRTLRPVFSFTPSPSPWGPLDITAHFALVLVETTVIQVAFPRQLPHFQKP
jgi:hypothetical protein